jgi:hypothetical protein
VVLGARAAGHLAAAGRRSTRLGDVRAAANLLGRAGSLPLPDSLERLEVMAEHAYALNESGRIVDAREVMEEVRDRAVALGDTRFGADRRPGQHLFTDTMVDFEELWLETEGLVETLAAIGDHEGLAKAIRRLGMVRRVQLRLAEATELLERALVHAEASGDLATRRVITQSLAMIVCQGPSPVDRARMRLEDLQRSDADDPVLEAVIARCLSLLCAMAGDLDGWRGHERRASQVLDSADMLTPTWVSQMLATEASQLAGDVAGAERALRAGWKYFDEANGGAPDARAMHYAYQLGCLYCDSERWDHAAACLAFDAAVPIVEDFATTVLLRLTGNARLAAFRRQFESAMDLAGHAVRVADGIDNLNLKAEVRLALAEVQRAAGDPAADESVADAVRLYERKGTVAMLDRLRPGLVQL